MTEDNSNEHSEDDSPEDRLNRLLDRVPNKEDFISEIEGYVDDVFPDVDELEASYASRSYRFLVPIFLLIAVIATKFLWPYYKTSPVSLDRLIELHSQEGVTRDIFVRHLEAKPFGEAIKPIMALADSGNVHAQNMTCWAHMDGLSVIRNNDLAISYCEMASNQGHSGARMNLGHLYYNNKEYFDLNKAINLYTLSAEHRAASAWNLSYIYENFPSPTQDFKKSIYYKKLAAELGYSQAFISLGNDYFEARLGLVKDYEQSLKYYNMAEEVGHPDAFAMLAGFYRKATPPFQDYKKMKHYSLKALRSNNHPMALSYLGDIYRDGMGVEKNPKRAAEYYNRCAMRNNTYCIGQLTTLSAYGSINYENVGYGFKYKGETLPYLVRYVLTHPEHFSKVGEFIADKSTSPLLVSKIFEYYADGTLGDHDHGEFPPHLMNVYFGDGYVEEFQPLLKAYEKMALWGSGKHAYQLGLIYMSGGGVVRNPKTSIEWISKALDLGYPDKQEYVGPYMMFAVESVEGNTQFARDTLYKAAALGSQKAAETLGFIYLEGKGVETDKVTAVYWYMHANQNMTVSKIQNSMMPDEILRAESLFTNCKKTHFFSCL